jgi:undecaprenyl-diphosphatase
MLHQDTPGISALAIGSGAVAGLVAFISVWVLMRYFKMRDFRALDPFAYYCWAFGLMALSLLVFAR